MRGAGQSRAWWAAGGAGDPAGGSSGFCFPEPGRRHRPVGCSFIRCCSPGIGVPAPARDLSFAAAGGAYGPALALRAPRSAQPGRRSPSAASSDCSCCSWWREATQTFSDLSLVPASRPSLSPRWLSLGPRVPLWLGWDRAAPGAPGTPADPLQAGGIAGPRSPEQLPLRCALPLRPLRAVPRG
ncbi:hypothetical protein NN561_000373 [Cricetulus griseus]